MPKEGQPLALKPENRPLELTCGDLAHLRGEQVQAVLFGINADPVDAAFEQLTGGLAAVTPVEDDFNREAAHAGLRLVRRHQPSRGHHAGKSSSILTPRFRAGRAGYPSFSAAEDA